MDVDHILRALNQEGVDFLLVGGMNFLLNHEPVLTYDVDIWVRDDDDNLALLHRALCALECQWGATEEGWGPLPADPGWLHRQALFCLTSPHGAIDVFRTILGLEGRYEECQREAASRTTAAGTPYPAYAGVPAGATPHLAKTGTHPYSTRIMNPVPPMSTEDKQREEAKRERAFDPLERWLAIQRTITWTETQLPPEKRRNRPRLPVSG